MNQDRFQTAGLVVAAGLFFLLINLRPELHVWEYGAKYWPLLPILWGLGEMAGAAWRAASSNGRRSQ